MLINKTLVNMQQCAIVLGGTASHIPLIGILQQRGFSTILVDYLENPVAATFADKHFRISTLDADSVLALAREYRAGLVISTSVDQANLTACIVSEKLGLPSPYPVETAMMVTDKLLMKQKMVSNNIPTANYQIVHADMVGKYKPIDMRFPLIVKPSDNCGSKGVRRVATMAELNTALPEAVRCSRNNKALVEEFIEGREICLDIIVYNGKPEIISVYEKFNIIGNKTVVQCFRSLRPVTISPVSGSKLADITNSVVKSFGLECTPLFIQTKVNCDDVYVIELGARVAGGLAANATRLSTGYDALTTAVDLWLGGAPDKANFKKSDEYITTNSIYATPSVFGYISGFDELKQNGTIEEYCIYKGRGMALSSDLTSNDRVAGFIIKDRDKRELFRKTEMAISGLEIFDTTGNAVMQRELFAGVQEKHIIY